MRGTSRESVTVESWKFGPAPLTPAPIRMVPASTAAASNRRSPFSVLPGVTPGVTQVSRVSRVICRSTNRRKYPAPSMVCGSHSPNSTLGRLFTGWKWSCARGSNASSSSRFGSKLASSSSAGSVSSSSLSAGRTMSA